MGAFSTAYTPKKAKHEEALQIRVCNYLRKEYPSVIFRSDYASGLKLTKYQAKTHRKMQSGRSWPDLFIYHPVTHKKQDGSETHYRGCAIELKIKGTTIQLKIGPNKGKLTTNPHIREQAAMLRELNRVGYYANFSAGYDETVKLIDWYMQRPQTKSIF